MFISQVKKPSQDISRNITNTANIFHIAPVYYNHSPEENSRNKSEKEREQYDERI